MFKMIIRAASRSLTRIRPSYALQCSRANPRPQLTARIQTAKIGYPSVHTQVLGYASVSEADEKIEEIQELYARNPTIKSPITNITRYANARDEVPSPPSPLPTTSKQSQFEIAAEETEKKTVYAADDRAAAQEELKKLKDAYKNALETSSPEVSAEIRGRVGQRIRELDHAIQGMEEAAKAD
jgi:hypothetical protein